MIDPLTDPLTALGLYGLTVLLVFGRLYATLRKQQPQVEAARLRFAALLALMWPYFTLGHLYARGQSWLARRRHHRVCPSLAYGQRDEDLPADPSYYARRPEAPRYQPDPFPAGVTAEQLRSVAQCVLAAHRATPTTLTGHPLSTRAVPPPAPSRATQEGYAATDDDEETTVWRVNLIRRSPHHAVTATPVRDDDATDAGCVPQPPKPRGVFQVFAHGRWRDVLHARYQSWGTLR